MLHTPPPLCDLLGIELPVIQAGMGPFTSAELVAAVSNAGGLGSLGVATRSVKDLLAGCASIAKIKLKCIRGAYHKTGLDKC